MGEEGSWEPGWIPEDDPATLDGQCYVTCKLKERTIKEMFTWGGASLGAIAGAIASIPSGTTTAGVTIPAGAVIGAAGGRIVGHELGNLKCDEKCALPTGCGSQ